VRWQEKPEAKPLMITAPEKKQPLGILPTREFWRDPENRRRAGPAFGLVVAASTVVVNLASHSVWVTLVAILVTMFAVLGPLEWYMRRSPVRRSEDAPT
jgi:hypothetical protein